MKHRVEKAVLLPLHFTTESGEEFNRQLAALHQLLDNDATILAPAALGSAIPGSVDAAVLPEVLGAAYRTMSSLKRLPVPILLITSEFGTVSMWDWEIAAYMRAEGIDSLAPTNPKQAKMICRALGV